MSGVLIKQKTAVAVATLMGGREGGSYFHPQPVRLLLMASSFLSPKTNGSHLSLCNVAYIIVLLVTDLCHVKRSPS